ncbi:MAG: 2-oxoacid:acceptor oxidoreductase subunit alpha [Prevotellaceae bacterium]|jgi:2-oxoglutarate ferredoxin oxidoreductase subunit alpha|nr:2-oxoacid:acceptor oxidoreductase subunit alpha [Prevotellaceae bacterium]
MNKTERVEIDDVVIRFSGDSGDGMQLTGTLFADTAALLGDGVSTFPDYPAEIRAPHGTVSGVSGFQVHISSGTVRTPGDFCDVLVAMNPAALKANAKWAKNGATIIVDADEFNEKGIQRAGFATLEPFEELGLQNNNLIFAPITSLTKESLKDSGLDNKAIVRSKNMFALGICYFIYDQPFDFTFKYFKMKFKKKPDLIEPNKKVLVDGYNYAANTHAHANTYKIVAHKKEKGIYRTISGNQATAWGLIAASEKANLPLFCGSYPITPATSILEELAIHKNLNVKTLQVEDEIAGICTAIGAAFAGNFAVTTTSGPGLSLKSEALGLAVMTELPLVVIDVQRGGPSTGLPTKTEQSDLSQALYGRNGECPVVVIAASTPSNCFHYAFYAGKIAMEHMTPVILLTDGFIANGSEPWKIPQMKDFPQIFPPIVHEGDTDYKPYKRDDVRLARRWALPETKGLEHRIGGLEKDFLSGEASHEPINHEKMVNVRAAKVARVQDFIPNQEVVGEPCGDVLVVGWGGTFGHLYSAVDELQKEGKKVSLAQFNYINPLPKNTGEIFQNFKKIIVCELNLGQFAAYLRTQFSNISFEQCNKVQGLPFTVAELKESINKLI